MPQALTEGLTDKLSTRTVSQNKNGALFYKGTAVFMGVWITFGICGYTHPCRTG